MNTLIQTLTENFTHAIHDAFPQLEKEISAEVTLSTQEAFGHYQCNSALKLAKLVGESPRSVAEKIVEGIRNLSIHETIQCEIAGPGFINIRFDAIFLGIRAKAMLLDPRLGVSTASKKEKIIIDFSSPNVAKEMH